MMSWNTVFSTGRREEELGREGEELQGEVKNFKQNVFHPLHL